MSQGVTLATRGPSATTLHDDDLPPLVRVNDQQASTRDRNRFQAIRLYLTVLVLAAAAAVIAERLGSPVLAALTAALYGLTLLLGLRASRRRGVRAGHVHRAAAECVASMAWLYMAGGRPFHSGVSDPDRLFAQRLEEHLGELRKVGWDDPRTSTAARGSGQITPAMRAVRAKPFPARRDLYLRDRLLEQASRRQAQSAATHRASVWWASVALILPFFALLAAVLQAAGLSGGWHLTGPLSVAAAAALAWQEARQHRPLTHAHALIAQDLESLHVVMSTVPTDEDWADAVADAERLMSPAHADWLARYAF